MLHCNAVSRFEAFEVFVSRDEKPLERKVSVSLWVGDFVKIAATTHQTGMNPIITLINVWSFISDTSACSLSSEQSKESVCIQVKPIIFGRGLLFAIYVSNQ